MIIKHVAFLVTFSSIAICSQTLADELLLFTSRKDHLIRPLAKAYEKETGVKVRLHLGKAAPLIERLKVEGEKTKADLFMTVDAGNLHRAKKEGVLRKVQSPTLKKNIAPQYRDQQNAWFGLSLRARTLIYHQDKINQSSLKNYRDLGESKWRKKLCLRTSDKVYNHSLLAMLLKEEEQKIGAQAARSSISKMLENWVANLAAPPFQNDTAVIKAIESGQCDIGVVNTYYFGRYQKKNTKTRLALFFPSAENGGTHVNISGAGLTLKKSNHKQALRFLEWLSKPKAQKVFAGVNLEYPIHPRATVDPLVRSWGKLEPSKTPLRFAGEYQPQALRLMQKAGYQ